MPMERTSRTFIRFWESITVSPDELAKINHNLALVRKRLLESFSWRTAPPPSRPADPYVEWRPPEDKVIIVEFANLPSETEMAPPALELTHLETMGSGARGTLIKPISDVDLLVVFQGEGGSIHVFRHFTPTSLLQRVADALQGIGDEIIIWAGESITVSFRGGVNIDVFPSFRIWDLNYAYFPRVGNAWKISAPPAFDRQFLASNERLGKRLTTVAKYAKAWNRNNNKLIESFHLEALVERDVTKVHDCRRVSLHQFFAQAIQRGPSFLSIPSPDGIYDDLAHYMTDERKRKAMIALDFSARMSELALNYEQQGNFLMANQCWHAVFGPSYPLMPKEDQDGMSATQAANARPSDTVPTGLLPEGMTQQATTTTDLQDGQFAYIVLPPGSTLTYSEESGGNHNRDSLLPYAHILISEQRIRDAIILLQQLVPAFNRMLGPADAHTTEAQELLATVLRGNQE